MQEGAWELRPGRDMGGCLCGGGAPCHLAKELFAQCTYSQLDSCTRTRTHTHTHTHTHSSRTRSSPRVQGGMGRFINHSCEPNCETQKWVVQGELAIGLFASTDVPAGSELTFDYNFERYGDKPMKCLCGSKGCRGMIGGVQVKAGCACRKSLKLSRAQ